MENNESVVPVYLDKIKDYVINLENKYILLATVIMDIYGIDGNTTTREVIEKLYEVAGKDIPDNVKKILDKE